VALELVLIDDVCVKCVNKVHLLTHLAG